MSLISLQADILTEGTHHFMKEISTKPTLLLVDDEAPVRDFIQMLLEGEGYQILTAVNGRDALETYNRFQSEIAMVISDIHMPNMNGEQLFSELKSRNPSLKLIAISGYAFTHKKEGISDENEIAFIAKPFSIDVLLEQVATMLLN